MKNLRITVNGTTYDVQVEEMGSPASTSTATPIATTAGSESAGSGTAQPAAGAGEPLNAPMPGTIVSVNVTNGQRVNEGDVIVILEAMKMENEIMAPKAGTVTSVCVSKGESVVSGKVLVTIQ